MTIQTMSQNELIWNVERSKNDETRYCFILGAGASVSSGIKSGITMAKEWMNDIHIGTLTSMDIKNRMNRYGVNNKNLLDEYYNLQSEDYFDLFALRFGDNDSGGYVYLEKAIKNAQPSLGYCYLANILANTKHNIVITTNFDSLIEDALYLFTEARPIVAGHEALAEYITLRANRPVIAKVHRSLYFKPFNSAEETKHLKDNWGKILREVFRQYTPIVIGYAGGDNSLMSFITEIAEDMKSTYWCHLKNESLTIPVKTFLHKNSGFSVDIDDFDEIMYNIGKIFPLGDIYNRKDPWYRLKQLSNKTKKYELADRLRDKWYIKEPFSIDTKVTETEAQQIVKEYPVYSYKTFPDTSDHYRKYGDAYFICDDYKKALEYYSLAVKRPQKAGKAFFNRGVTYHILKEYELALSDYNSSRLHGYNSSFLDFNFAIVYHDLGDTEKAESNYKHAKNVLIY